jgi:hypothetical protein
LSKLFKALADPARLRILGLLAERPRAGYELAQELELTPPTISHHMRRLDSAGLIDVKPDAQARVYSLRMSSLRKASQDVAGEAPSDATGRDEEPAIAAFFDGPRLRQIPAARKKRVLVLRRLLQGFTPGRDYDEREVNDILRVAHEDVATLRRELVNYGLMQRDHGVYRVAAAPPPRGATVRQEVGDEAEWFPRFIAEATARAVNLDDSIAQRTRPEPPE